MYYMIKTCIVREPCMEMVDGITSTPLEIPDYERALKQHAEYIRMLERCGCRVIRLPAEPAYPDSVFVEDVALFIKEVVVLTSPGAESRRGEVNLIKPAIEDQGLPVEEISGPGSLDAGDVLEVDEHYYIGLSGRTNREGSAQLISILEKYGKTGSTVRLKDFLHLKTGVAYLGNDTLLLAGELKEAAEFEDFKRIEVDEDEEYAANSIMVNGRLIVPAGFPETAAKLKAAGFDIFTVDTSEFRKLDGGLSCLSLRF